MWQLKTSVISIVAGALELVKKRTAKHLEKIIEKISGKKKPSKDTKNSTYQYCTHIKKNKIKTQNLIKTTQAHKKFPFQFPKFSGRDLAVGLQ